MRLGHFIAAIAVGLFYHIGSVQGKPALDRLEALADDLVKSSSLDEASSYLVPLSNLLLTGKVQGSIVKGDAATMGQPRGLRSTPANVSEKTRILYG